MKTTEQKKRSKLKVIFPWLGWLGFSLCIGIFCVTGCSHNTMMNEQASSYKKAKSAVLSQAGKLNESEASEALGRLGDSLKHLDAVTYIETEMPQLYA